MQFRCGSYIEDYLVSPWGKYPGLERIYGDDYYAGRRIIEVGNVETEQGRLLAFANVCEHNVSSFELVDKSRPGHRKFVVLWLVNPQKRIISTEYVPPQQKDHFRNVVRDAALHRFPAEICDMISDATVGHFESLAEA